MARRKCYISFKTEDMGYKEHIQERMNVDMIDKSLDTPINSTNEDYIMKMIRQDYLADSTVTIFLIGAYGAESRGAYEQRFIKKELQASLYHGVGNTQNGILGVVLPNMVDTIFKGSYDCQRCGGSHNFIAINDSTVIKEFSSNYYIPKEGKCSWAEDDRFCILTTWEQFKGNPEYYIELAFQKRLAPVSYKTIVYPK